MSTKTAQQWIDSLKLVPLPEEGGWYNEVYRSDEMIKEAVPGFEFVDFEAPSREVLLETYPQHSDIIRALTRE